jgi:hypothetical protein
MLAAASIQPPASTLSAAIIGTRQRERREIAGREGCGVIGREPPPAASSLLTRRRPTLLNADGHSLTTG